MALIDVFLSGIHFKYFRIVYLVSYILLFPVNLFMDYFESELLAQIWWTCLRPMLTLCHVAISSSALLLLAATFERFLIISRIRSQFSTKFRLILSSLALFFALAAKGPMFFELEVSFNKI